MKIEQVRLLRTLQAGKDVWVEGSYFPNKDYPSIPHEILMEVKHQTGRVEVTQQSDEVTLPEKAKESPKLTSTSVDATTSLKSRASLEEARQREKAEIESAELPKKSKSKLVRRK
ncbi:MAG: hypothetical protein ACYSOO_05555 [Planctomycetota bacterium]|jgi:hypothetical protein